MYCLLHLMQDKESLWLVEQADNVETLKKHPYFTCLAPGDKWFFVKADYSMNLYKYDTYVKVKCSVDKTDNTKLNVNVKKEKVYSKVAPRLFNKNELCKMTVVDA